MRNNILNEELIRQINLMGFDRSKTLLEQKPDKFMPGQPDNPMNIENSYEVDCKDKEDFIDTYPNCCKYKEISILPPEGKEWINFNEEKKLGYCYVNTKIPGVGLNVSNDDTLTFATQTTQQEMVEKLVAYYVADDFKMYRQQIGDIFTVSETFKQIEKSNQEDSEDVKIDILTEYFSKLVGTYFPINSVVRIETKEGNGYSASLVFDDTNNEFRFDYWYDQDGQPYKQASWQDNRNQYQKFIDDYGVAVQLGVLLGASILTIATEGATSALLFEIAAELGVGAAIAQRDFEKGDNIMGWVNLLSGGVSALKFMKYFRGISKADLDATVNALKNSGLPENASKEQVMEFLKTIKDPKITNVINKASKLDDYSMNTLKSDLAQDMTASNVLKEMKEIIKADPKIIGNVKFFERLWVLDLKRQLGFMFAGVALNMTPLADVLNNTEKQKYQWILQNLPENQAKSFDMVAATSDPQETKKLLGLLEHKFKVRNEEIKNNTKGQAAVAFNLQTLKEKLDREEKKIEVGKEKSYTVNELIKLGYKEITIDEIENLPLSEEIQVSDNGKYFIIKKEETKNNK
jgi:metal-sulfur cluster biosynthetic enzyme